MFRVHRCANCSSSHNGIFTCMRPHKINHKKCGFLTQKIRAYEKTVLGITVGELLPDDDVHFVLNQCLTPRVPKGQNTQHRIQLSDLMD